MNERLIELQKQAYQFADRNTQEGDNQFATIQLGKFAELLIEDCKMICRRNHRSDICDDIAKHFRSSQ